ncbi:MAG: NirD/YgiW/YdeI family stress tolerance protein [Xenococcaceae cyanobacterium]
MKVFLKTSITCLITASNLIFISSSILAQTEVTSISQILAEPKDDMEVRIRGKIIDQQLGEDDFIFTDGQDKITLEIDQKNFQYSSDETIEIYGVVSLESIDEEDDHDPTPEVVEIEVKEIKLVQE